MQPHQGWLKVPEMSLVSKAANEQQSPAQRPGAAFLRLFQPL